MRMLAVLDKPNHGIVRLMIHKTDSGVYVFGYNTLEDSGGLWDQWYVALNDAIQDCLEEYGVKASDWKHIDDPQPYCQQDWIAPVRIKGRNLGEPEFGILEKLMDGKWTVINK